MSDLSELIKINRNIEKQNEEIIRLLKKIAGEKEEPKDPFALDKEMSRMFVSKMVEDLAEKGLIDEESKPVEQTSSGLPLDIVHDVGEVIFIEGDDIFKLSVKNNETTVDNLTSDGEAHDFKLQEMIANESIKNNQSLDNGTVILNESQSKDLAETLKMCVENGAKNVYVPLSESKQLMWSLDAIRTKINIDFYKDEDFLIEKIFGR
ncbi:MAG: hypothetical protein U0L42_05785 [Methanobrevibacter sp.]|uniref:hypothetical protein n=1 Tax=Methanobrevibacter sp. TaxID=66852 RepID=UPI002E7A1ED0|nr:hypothetical protein [Methanobrevibacter sp.]MEE0935165.1 hypothetical protein [Methanobrevibacter sp.]